MLAQDGNPEVFVKKNIQPAEEVEEVNQQDPSTANQEQEEPGSLIPGKENKNTSGEFRSATARRTITKPDTAQVNTKEKESKSKYNILLYYFYKSKHEETEEKGNTTSRDN